jgi:hypothetical protein
MTYQPHQSEDPTTRPVARVGDRLCVQVQHPSPRTITMILATPESAAYANELLSDPASGWKLADAASGVSPTSHPTFCRDTPAKEG